MAAATRERNTVRYGQEPSPALWSLQMKASTKIYAGTLVVVDAGYAAPARTATGLRALGRAEQTVDNTAGAAGALLIDVLSGVFKFANSTAGDQIVQADYLKDVYIVDDQTVAKTDGTGARSKAGVCMGVDPDGGVWVLTGPLAGK